MGDLGLTVASIATNSLNSLGGYLPQFLAGLVLLLIGLAVSAVLKELVLRFLKILKIEDWLNNVATWFNKIKSEGNQKNVWVNLIGELVRWTVVILFLVPAVEAWGLPRVTDLLNQFLLYIPNVFVAVVVGFIGLVMANLVFDIVNHTSKTLGSRSSHILANIARYALIFFTGLVVLNQLGVASDLVRILFTGIVAMLAVAGGIAFGLGGQSSARRLLENFEKRMEGKD